MRKTLTLTLTLPGLLTVGLAHASSGVALQAIIAALTAESGKSPAKIVADLEARGFQRVCNTFVTAAPGVRDLKVCWSKNQWIATLEFPHVLGQPTFRAALAQITQRFGPPATRAGGHFAGGPRTDVWYVRQARLSLERSWPSEDIKLRISSQKSEAKTSGDHHA